MTNTNSHSRTIWKTVVWRIIATLTTSAVVWLFSGDVSLAIGVGVVEAILKMILYYLHERLWIVKDNKKDRKTRQEQGNIDARFITIDGHKLAAIGDNSIEDGKQAGRLLMRCSKAFLDGMMLFIGVKLGNGEIKDNQMRSEDLINRIEERRTERLGIERPEPPQQLSRDVGDIAALRREMSDLKDRVQRIVDVIKMMRDEMKK